MPGVPWSGLGPSCVAGVWLYLSLLAAKYPPVLLHSVGQEPFYPLLITGTYRYCLVKKALGTFRFSAAQVAFPALGPHNFTAASNMEAALCPFMSLNFRHLGFFYLFLFFSFLSNRW